MTDWAAPYSFSPHCIVAPFSPEFWGEWTAVIAENNTAGTVQQNRAYVYPFKTRIPRLVTGLGWINGATVDGNVDVAIYDNTLARLLAAGSTVQTGTNAKQTVTVSATTLQAGLYYLAISSSSATATFARAGHQNIVAFNPGGQRMVGFWRQDSTAPPLPSTIGGTAGFTHTQFPIAYIIVGRVV